MKLIYGIEDKPKFSKTLVFAFQQMIAIMAATLLVPLLVTSYGLQADAAAALFGAGIGTIVYLFCTKRRSPVFLGSSFTFLGAYAATIGQNYGYWGMLIGVAFAGLVYVIIGLVIKVVGSGWVNKLMPSVIIGPIVALIGLSLSGTATSWIMGNGAAAVVYGETYNWAAIICGIFTFFMIVIASVKGSKPSSSFRLSSASARAMRLHSSLQSSAWQRAQRASSSFPSSRSSMHSAHSASPASSIIRSSSSLKQSRRTASIRLMRLPSATSP